MQDRWSQAQVPPATDNVLRILAVLVVGFILETIGRGFLGVTATDINLQFNSNFHPTQLITHIFSSGDAGRSFFGALIHLAFEGIILWSFGSELERNWGSTNFLKMFYLGILAGIILALMVALVLPGLEYYGIGGAMAALLVSYAVIWPDRQVLFMFVIPVKIKWLVLVLFIFLVFGGWGQFILYSAGGATGAAFVYYYARRGRQAASGEPAGLMDKFRERMRKRRLRKKQDEINRRIDMKSEVDRLLEKISTDGMDSLSRKEKAFLDSASKEF